MKKRIIAVIGAALLCVSIAATAFAADVQTAPAVGYGCGGYACGMHGEGYSLMRDADGNLLDKEAFEANLDSLIGEGVISESDRDFYVERYELCLENGGLPACGMGMGHGHGHGRGHGHSNSMRHGW
jgi:hypothetical protein